MCRIRIQKLGETHIKVINLKNGPRYLYGAFINTKQELVYGGDDEYFIKCLAENQLDQQDDTPIHMNQEYKWYLHVSPCQRFYHLKGYQSGLYDVEKHKEIFKTRYKEPIVEISSNFCIQKYGIGHRVINLSESMKTSTQMGLQTGPIDAFCPDQHIIQSGNHTISIADGSVYNQNAPYQLILQIQQGTLYITLVNDTIYWVTAVSNGEDYLPSNIKVQCKCINSQEEPKCIEINENFMQTYKFEG